MNEDLIKMRDIFKECADIIDEILALGVREAAGEDVKKESESVLGRFAYKMIEMESMQSEK